MSARARRSRRASGRQSERPHFGRQDGELIELRIERLVAGGAGLGRVDGRVVLVEDAAPGDLLRARVTERHAGYLRARAAEILEAGPGRREPPCRHAARCGGCSLQHLDYERQLESKVQILRESFARVAKLPLPAEIRVERCPEWGYRRKARFHAHVSGGQVELGFRARDGHSIVDLENCPVLTGPLVDSLPGLRARRLRGDLEDSISVVDADGATHTGTSQASIRVGEDRLTLEPEGFFQANAPLLERLVRRVVELAGAGAVARSAQDLYAGVGLFSLGLARRFASVVCVEGEERARQLLAENARAAGLANLEVVATESVERWLAGAGAARLQGACVVVDPPRAGLSRSVRQVLVRERPLRIVHVACDPVSLARDAGDLVRGGYALRSIDLFDLFPQTHHFETLARFDASALL